MPNPSETSLDVQFSVPFVHRLRVTDDVSREDLPALLSVIEAGSGERAKVLLIAERSLSEPTTRIAEQLGHANDIDMVHAPVLVDGGEGIKNSSKTVERILQQINQLNLDRRSYIVAIGGGAMLDAVGYAAAVAHRGIRLIRLPTTTLAQADSGVGVKNAINHFEKKNWIGTFAVPWAVINDASLLQTLPDRDFRCGFSEAVKVSLLKSQPEFSWLCENADAIRERETVASKRAVHQSCLLHLKHITHGGDPFEMLEARPLDFGHWSAHRLEPLTHYQIRHGEAVAIGVAIDTIYSSLKFGFPEQDMRAVCKCLTRLGIQLWHEELTPIERLMQGLEEFRQHLGGRLTITMLRGVGDPIDVHEIDHIVMRNAIDQLQRMQQELASSNEPKVGSNG
ncbi:MAG: 3-dehydroquinate synthase [Rubripirellula sp.]|nr:3-dehydroquinate synthase [Rhodopirellula sp.]MCH1439312.1 3-dehydroquinate synthase [Rubripirellula sp.]OUX05567.1 MAG: 3-dehydroquinate synthase [Planctomycetaceae bacterium TMED240]